MPRHRFKVIEYASGYAVRNVATSEEKWMSDGVDVLFDKDGKPRSPGSEPFRRAWERVLNEDPDETAEAYFGRRD